MPYVTPCQSAVLRLSSMDVQGLGLRVWDSGQSLGVGVWAEGLDFRVSRWTLGFIV